MRCEVAGMFIPPLPVLLFAVVLVQLNWGLALLSVPIPLTESPLKRRSVTPLGDDVWGTVRSRSWRMSAGGGRSILNGKSWPVEAVAESGMVGDLNDEVEDVNDDPLRCPSVWSSSNWGLLAPSGSLMISPYSSSFTSPEVSPKSPTAGGGRRFWD